MAGKPQLRILCFGDSLSAGYSCHGAIYHPYAEKLSEMLAMAFPDAAFDETVDGVPGDRVVHGAFHDRMVANFKKGSKAGFDWTIVLGGTNDLAYANITPEEIFTSLKKIWDIPLMNKSKVLALTVPEVGVKGDAGARVSIRRNKLNTMIKEYKKENFFAFDLHAAVPYFDMSESDRERYWDDGVHFTSEGYDLIGQHVGIGLVSLLEKERDKISPPRRKRKRMFKDDNSKFEEEKGDPTALAHGYVVVRWTDLD